MKIKHPSWLVPIKIAKKLKKVGFNTNTLFLYNEEEDPKIMLGLCTLDEVDGQSNLEIEQLYFYQEADMETYECILPTWEQVLEWFIKQNLIGTIEYGKFDEKDPYFSYCITDNMAKVLDYSSNTVVYKTYQEARVALVNKLIKLYEQKRTISQ